MICWSLYTLFLLKSIHNSSFSTLIQWECHCGSVCLFSKWNILFLIFFWKFSDFTFVNIAQWYFLTSILVVLIFVNTGTAEKDLCGQKFDIKIIKNMIQVWSNYFQVKFIALILFNCKVMVLISTFIMASGHIKLCSNGWCLSYFPCKVSVLFLKDKY